MFSLTVVVIVVCLSMFGVVNYRDLIYPIHYYIAQYALFFHLHRYRIKYCVEGKKYPLYREGIDLNDFRTGTRPQNYSSRLRSFPE